MATDDKLPPAEKVDPVEKVVQQISELKALTLVGYVESLKDRLTSKDASLREDGINELVRVGMKLPGSELDDRTSDFLLEFLLPRVEDTGHLADMLVTGIHYLIVHNQRKLSNEIVERVMTVLLEESGVQSYGQRDRMLIFQILGHFLEGHLEALQLLGPQRLVMLFMRSANSERDPRCLLKIFQLFNTVVKNFSMGVLVEDMFELVACYFPIDYEPNERDMGKLSKDMLSAGCESCLLAHQSFAPFCFQLVAEKLVEDAGDGGEAHLKQQLAICAFLTKACDIFVGNGLRPHLDDLLTAFRLICLSPAHTKSTLHSASIVLGSTTKAMVKNLEQSSENPSQDLRFMAQNTIENCEPFVLQAEMGLTTKALILLDAIADSSHVARLMVVPRVLYWLNALLAGITLKSAENRQEIAEEAIGCLPRWIQLAEGIDRTDEAELTVKKAFVDIFADLKALETFCDQSKLLAIRFDCCSSIVASFAPIEKQQENQEVVNVDKALTEICDQLLVSVFVDKCSPLNQPSCPISLVNSAKNFLSVFSFKDFDRCKRLLTSPPVDIKRMVLDDDRILSFFGALIQDQQSARWISPIIFSALEKREISQESCSALEEIIKRLYKCSTSSDPMNVFGFQAFLSNMFNKVDLGSSEVENLANLLQDIGLQLDSKQHDSFVNWVLEECALKPDESLYVVLRISYLLFVQSKTITHLEKFIVLLTEAKHKDDEERERIALSVFFAAVNRCGMAHNESIGRIREKLSVLKINRERMKIVEAKAYLLMDGKRGIAMVTELFTDFLSSPIPGSEAEAFSQHLSSDLLDFSSRWADPERCGYECTLLWRQRVMCQFVPIYVEYFGRIGEDDTEKRACFLRLVESLLRLAGSVSVPMVNELKMITPIFTAALPMALEKQGMDMDLLLDGSLQLIQMRLLEEAPDSVLKVFTTSFLEILRQSGQSMTVILKTLDCLEVLSKKVSSERLATFYGMVVEGTTLHSDSKRRIVRQKAANVRNSWELALG